jgi:hypothetical protein
MYAERVGDLEWCTKCGDGVPRNKGAIWWGFRHNVFLINLELMLTPQEDRAGLFVGWPEALSTLWLRHDEPLIYRNPQSSTYPKSRSCGCA